MRGQFWDLEVVIRSEPVILIGQHSVIEVVIQQRSDEPSVLVVGDPSSVVALCSQILQGREGNTVILINEHLQLPN